MTKDEQQPIKVIKLQRRTINLKDYIRRSATDDDYETLITEPTIVVDADTNEVQIVYANLNNSDMHKQVYAALERLKFDKSTRTNGLVTYSRIFGYAPRNAIRNDTCTSTSLSVDAPREHDMICKYGEYVAQLYSNTNEEAYKKHLASTNLKVLEQYRIPKTPFTSGIINKNNPLKYHFDAGNYRNVYSCMIAFKHKIEGGHLSIPEYNIGLEIADGTATMFDGQELLHGVTPIRKLSPYSRRYTMVYYSLQGMWECLPLDDEVARYREKKMATARKHAAKVTLEEYEEEIGH